MVIIYILVYLYYNRLHLFWISVILYLYSSLFILQQPQYFFRLVYFYIYILVYLYYNENEEKDKQIDLNLYSSLFILQQK